MSLVLSFLRFYSRALVIMVAGLLLWSGLHARQPGAVNSAEALASVQQAPPVEQKPEAQHIEPDYELPVAETGSVPVISRIPTDQKVVFLTLDDGLVRKPEAQKLLDEYNIKAPMFLNDEYARADPPYFKKLLKTGLTIGSHTVDHADLTTLGYDGQVAEICTNADTLEFELGVRPKLFRPPYGSYDANTVQAAAVCGMRALVMWSAKANGGSMQYQDGQEGLVPGDIVLMHFREEFAEDFTAFTDAAEQAGLQPASLDEWLQ